jgi:hypothetical protein
MALIDRHGCDDAFPLESLDVSLFRTVTLRTISLAGAAVLATHAAGGGVGFGFFAAWPVYCRQLELVVVVRRYAPPPITQGGVNPRNV